MTINHWVALATGTLFGLGLSISQMINPEKVLGFLDIFGHWDPSLGLVMAAALVVTYVANLWVKSKEQPVLGGLFRVPTKATVDTKLVVGSAIFGVGWGLAGYCPGPVITSISFADTSLIVLLVAYLFGALFSKNVISHIEHRIEVRLQKQNESCVG